MLPRPLNTPAKVYLDITARCNLRCRYCYHFDSPAAVSVDLSAEEWVAFIREMELLGVFRVNISGGEPLIRPDILQILSAFKEGRMRFELITNGALITREHAEFIANLNRCDFVQISLDGPESVHDFARGKGAFAGAVRGIKILQEFNIPIRIRNTIGTHNVGTLAAACDIIFNDLRLKSFTTNCVVIENLCEKSPEALELSIDDLLFSIEEHRSALEMYPGRIISNTGPWGLYQRWKQLYNTWLNAGVKGHYSGCLGGCGAIFKQMGVRADGVMVPCVQLPGMEMGRINCDSLKEVWLNSPQINRIRNRRNVELTAFTQCVECRYNRYCTGGCPAGGAVDEADMQRKVCRLCLRDIELYIGEARMKELLNR